MIVFPAPASVCAPRRMAADRAWPRVFEHLFAEAGGAARPDARPRVPALDVSETDTAYQLSFELPGLTRDQLKVSVLGRRVELETSPAATAPVEGERPLYRERSQRAFARTVSLPAEVDPDTVAAKFDNGVLHLTLAKKLPATATRIRVD